MVNIPTIVEGEVHNLSIEKCFYSEKRRTLVALYMSTLASTLLFAHWFVVGKNVPLS